jgi:hypothetical protein
MDAVVVSILCVSIVINVRGIVLVVDNNEQFMMLELLRGQLDEIHEAINVSLMSSMTKDIDALKLGSGESKKVLCRIGIVNVGVAKPEYVVEELSRLKSMVISLGRTLDYMRAGISEDMS